MIVFTPRRPRRPHPEGALRTVSLAIGLSLGLAACGGGGGGDGGGGGVVGADVQLRGTVRFVRDLGASVETFVDLDDRPGEDSPGGDPPGDGEGGEDGSGHSVVAVAMPGTGEGVQVGERVGLRIDMARAVVLPR